MALALCLGYSGYCYSEVIVGITNNAAADSFKWDMSDVLPPQAGLTIGNVFYRYSVQKNVEDDFIVTIRNQNPLDETYTFSETDDWSGMTGTTLIKSVPTADIPREYWGTGEIHTEGDGTVFDPSIRYAYKFDPCYEPLTSPECPGYEQAQYQWLLDNGMFDAPLVEDPYYNDEVQNVLNTEVELEEDELIKDDNADSQQEDKRRQLASDNAKMIDYTKQNMLFEQLSLLPRFDVYYTVSIAGGVYEDVLKLEDKQLPDNKRAFGSLARDEQHREMVRSQYDR